MNDLAGRVAVITGGASGIGRALARSLASEGMRIVLADIEESALETAAASLRSEGSEVLSVVTDVSSAASVSSLAERSRAHFGPVDVLCNNAGVGMAGRVWETPVPVWEWTLGVNLWGVIHGINAFVPGMVERNQGHVINTASVAGLLTPPVMGAYTASKHAVVGVSETLYHELSLVKSDVGVSVLCPGAVDTNIGGSERNWPGRLGRMPEVGADRMSTVLRDRHHRVMARGAAAEAIAGMAVDAIRNERFWILSDVETHGPGIERRFANAVAGRNPDRG